MANIKSARKRAHQAIKNRAHNMRLRGRLRTTIKKAITAVAELKDKQEIAKVLSQAYSIIDSSANKKLIHKNKAARYKSRLNRLARNAP